MQVATARLLGQLDELIARRWFSNRSQAIEAAVAEKLARLTRSRLVRECAKLDRDEERALAEEGMTEDTRAWPEY
jgi:metal-responsive CopG/Arc/MetJ family transcriptional regulator